MYLVHEKKHQDGKWEVAWMWLPHFLAADRELHKYVDKQMTEKFRGSMLQGDVYSQYPPSMRPLLQEMHDAVIVLILERYPIPGLRRFLEGYIAIRPDEEGEDESVGSQDQQG